MTLVATGRLLGCVHQLLDQRRINRLLECDHCRLVPLCLRGIVLLRNELAAFRLDEVRFQFDFDGTKTLLS